MLSIITLSNNKARAASLEKIINETSGLVTEFICLADDGKTGICKAYNEGAAKARNDYLCFVHDDVHFHTSNWGQKIVDHLRDESVGVIGIAGGRYTSKFGMGWRDGDMSMLRFNLKDGVENGKLLYYNPANEKTSQVLCIDGVFLCCRKATWQQYPFDEKLFTGFHFYDMDFCMQVSRQYKNFVVYDVLLEHFSQGKIDKNWLRDAQHFAGKWHKHLPAFADELPAKTINRLEGYAAGNTLAAMKKLGVSVKERFKFFRKYLHEHKNLYFILRCVYFGFLK